MEPSMLTSFIGAIFFTLFMGLGYIYANGKWKVAENKEKDYQVWLTKHGETAKKTILILSVLYGCSIVFQVYQLLWV